VLSEALTPGRVSKAGGSSPFDTFRSNTCELTGNEFQNIKINIGKKEIRMGR
jgi:hypothetical protein